MTFDKEKLVKILKLAGSDKDGEALSAIRIANKMLKACDVEWESLLLSGGSRSSNSPADYQRGLKDGYQRGYQEGYQSGRIKGKTESTEEHRTHETPHVHNARPKNRNYNTEYLDNLVSTIQRLWGRMNGDQKFFADSVITFYKERKYLTERQVNALNSIVKVVSTNSSS